MPTTPHPHGGDHHELQVGPWTDFTDAATVVVEQLARLAPLDLWLVSRTVDDSEVVVAAAGPGAPVSSRPSLTIPLVVHDGSLHGWLHGHHRQPEAPVTAGALRCAELAGRTLSTVLDTGWARREREREVSLVRALAEHDGLTGIRNRRGWEARLVRERRTAGPPGPLAVLVLDLDDLKRVNDALGHAQGDALLLRCASVLRTTCRTSDVLARPGGDEFTVLARLGPAGTDELERRLRTALAAAGVAASVGAAVHAPGEDLHDTWRRADAAMYRDKRARKGTAVYPALPSRPTPRAPADEPLPAVGSADGHESPAVVTGRRPAGSCTGHCAMPP